MQMRLFRPLGLFSLLTLLVISGCPSAGPNVEPAGPSHEDAHAHALGPAGGHLLELGDEEYHVEWTHDDENGVLTFIIRDADAKDEVPIDAEEIIVDLTAPDETGAAHQTEVKIAAVGRTDENPRTARFELTNKIMMANIVENEKAKAVLRVTIDGKPYSAEIEHEAHDHGHSHSHSH
ncbi:MAG: hypothetical protein KDA41_11130 [Planctomycetales bacterium]|nr:hypothetical protein [Planctomycetales bacterium]